jgi:hypothetical protein
MAGQEDDNSNIYNVAVIGVSKAFFCARSLAKLPRFPPTDTLRPDRLQLQRE